MSSDIQKVFVHEYSEWCNAHLVFDVEPEFFVLSSKNSVTHYKQYPHPRFLFPNIKISESELDSALSFLIKEVVESRNECLEAKINEIEEKANHVLKKEKFKVHNILTGSRHKIKTKKAEVLYDENIDSDLAVCFVEPEYVGHISKSQNCFSVFIYAPQYIVPVRIKP